MSRRQCPVQSKPGVGLQCQRLAKHKGLHAASFSAHAPSHFEWADDANPFGYEVLPGTVWFHRPDPSRLATTARCLGEWTALMLVVLGLWRYASLPTAATFLALELLLSVRKAHFVDLGRFTAGVWSVTPAAPLLIFGIAWALHGEGRNAKKAGIEVTLGPVVVGAFSLVPRKEWPAYKRSQAAFDARQKERR